MFKNKNNKGANTMEQLIYNKDSFDNSIEVSNYPWGFRLKTKVRYWIETTNRGDRFVKCTLNPKTQKWCAEKKSTYSSVMVMTTDEKDNKTYVSYYPLNIGYDDAIKVAKFEHSIDKDKLSKKQLTQICKCKAVNEVNKKIKVEFVSTNNWTSEQREEHNKKQDELNGKLANYTNHLYKKCIIKNNLTNKKEVV